MKKSNFQEFNLLLCFSFIDVKEKGELHSEVRNGRTVYNLAKQLASYVRG